MGTVKAELSPPDIVAWLRAKAKMLEGMADEIATMFPYQVANGMPKMLGGPGDMANGSRVEVLSEDSLYEAVKKRSGRIDSIAKRLNTSEGEVRRVLGLDGCRVEIADRGWFRIKEGQ